MRRNFSSLPQRLHRAMHMGGVAADLRRPGGRQHGRSPRRRSGIAFLIGWGASTVNALWGRGFDLQPVRGVVMSFAGVLIAAGLFGSIRLNFLAPSSPTVVAATVTIDRAVHDRAIGPPFVRGRTPNSGHGSKQTRRWPRNELSDPTRLEHAAGRSHGIRDASSRRTAIQLTPP